MRNIDWFYLKKPLLFFFVALIFSVAISFAGFHYEKIQFEEYQNSVSSLRSTHALYKNIINDIDLLEQYRNLYSEYKSSGLVGDERRLSWIESLESTNQVLKLPQLSYNLQPQEEFKRPGFKQPRGVEVKSSPMELTIGLLHEEDLFSVFEGLRLSISSLFTVESCKIDRPSVSSTLHTKATNLFSTCTIRWVTINAK